jgi:hypothetical protein
MKTKIMVNGVVSLDEVTYQLQNTLSTKELVKFVMQLGDKLTDSRDYYLLLRKEIEDINFGS